MSDKPSYLGLLNGISLAESRAHCYLGAWIETSRNPDVLWNAKPGDIATLVQAQARLLDSAARRTSPGGRLVFSVCSLGVTGSFFGSRMTRLLRRMRGDRETNEIAEFCRSVRPRGHRNFAGAVEATHWN